MALVIKITDLVNSKEQTKTFSGNVISFGRAKANDLVLTSLDVSAKHGEIVVREVAGNTQFFVRDLNSSNGTFIEGLKISPQSLVPLSLFARVIIGSSYHLQILSYATASNLLPCIEDSFYSAEIKLKQTIHGKIIERIDLRRKDISALSDGELRTKTKDLVEQIIDELRWELPAGLSREKLVKDILDETLGLGPLEELLLDVDCSEIMLNSYQQIYAERKGKLELTDLRFSSEQAVLLAIERIIAPIGRHIDESSPMVDARLKDGSRVNAVIRPLALNGPCITIRKFSKTPLTIENLVNLKTLTKGMSIFLKLAVKQRLNIVISGGTGSGKTTLLNVISGFIPEGRIITIEDAAELSLPLEHVVSFETRPANLEGKGAVAIRDLVRNALRMRPDRIIVGECRGPEALDMLQAMNTGHDGSMTTGHANTPLDMLRRLETMVLMAGLDLPVRAIREQIASAVNIIVQQTRYPCGSRKISKISEVLGISEDGVIELEDIFVFKQEGYTADGKVLGDFHATGYIPKFVKKLQERGVEVDADMFGRLI